ncbi:MAG: cation transporter [Acidimicrobiia bacterium]
MTEHTLSVPDISCGHCKMSIEGAVSILDGIDEVEVHIDERTVDVVFDQAAVDLQAIVDAIESQGYAVAT